MHGLVGRCTGQPSGQAGAPHAAPALLLICSTFPKKRATSSGPCRSFSVAMRSARARAGNHGTFSVAWQAPVPAAGGAVAGARHGSSSQLTRVLHDVGGHERLERLHIAVEVGVCWWRNVGQKRWRAGEGRKAWGGCRAQRRRRASARAGGVRACWRRRRWRGRAGSLGAAPGAAVSSPPAPGSPSQRLAMSSSCCSRPPAAAPVLASTASMAGLGRASKGVCTGRAALGSRRERRSGVWRSARLPAADLRNQGTLAEVWRDAGKAAELLDLWRPCGGPRLLAAATSARRAPVWRSRPGSPLRHHHFKGRNIPSTCPRPKASDGRVTRTLSALGAHPRLHWPFAHQTAPMPTHVAKPALRGSAAWELTRWSAAQKKV